LILYLDILLSSKEYAVKYPESKFNETALIVLSLLVENAVKFKKV
jgi:hypothetical protein